MKRIIALPLLASLALAACGGGADPADVADAVRQTEQVQLEAIEAGDLRGIARLYAENARLVRPDGSVLDGQAAIEAEYGRLLEDPNFAIAIDPQVNWTSEAGDFAALSSHVDFTTTDPETGEPTTMPLNSQTVWFRGTGGTWQIVSAYNVEIVGEEEEEGEAAAE